MNKLCVMLISLIYLSFDVYPMENRSYQLPTPASDGSIGGLINVPQDVFHGKFTQGQQVAPLQVLELRFNARSSHVRAQFNQKYNIVKANLEKDNIPNYTQHPDFLLILEVGRRLNLIDDNGNIINYAVSESGSRQQINSYTVHEEVEVLIAAQAEQEDEFQGRQSQEDSKSWLDHWLTPALVRIAYAWWNRDATSS